MVGKPKATTRSSTAPGSPDKGDHPQIDVRRADIDADNLFPVELIEHADTGDRFIVYANENGQAFELRFEGEEPWATERQIAELFGVTQQNANYHINQIYKSGELPAPETTYKEFLYVGESGQTYRPRAFNLDVILAVGHRVKSKEGILFRRWARQIERQYLLKGFVIDEARLEDPDGRPDFFEELMQKVRSIRASEKRMWTRVLELASFCTDYHAMTDSDKETFFATIQNTMHWAVTQETAAEVIAHRVDASKPNAGVLNFKGEQPTVKEAQVAKNYYAEPEINALNILTSATLEFFESQAEQRRPTTIQQFLSKMRSFIELDGRPLISDRARGSISMEAAKGKAADEIATYKERGRLEKEAAGEKIVGDLLAKAREIAVGKRKQRQSRSRKKG